MAIKLARHLSGKRLQCCCVWSPLRNNNVHAGYIAGKESQTERKTWPHCSNQKHRAAAPVPPMSSTCGRSRWLLQTEDSDTWMLFASQVCVELMLPHSLVSTLVVGKQLNHPGQFTRTDLSERYFLVTTVVAAG